MAKQILINSTQQETRIALMDDDRVMELFFERNSDKGIVGNVYKGKVVRVLPGMQAAFVDIGHERAAFLYAGDFYHSRHNTAEFEDDEDDENDRPGGRSPNKGRRRRNYDDVPPIAQLVKEGQEILVQVAKGPIGTKGARVTCHLSLPGRFVVFMPTLKHNGVSRKIDDFDLRKRLKKMIDQHKSEEGGFIVRTAAGNTMSEKQIRNDVDYLKSLWSRINRKFKTSAAPRLLHYDLDLTTRTIRDNLDEDIEYLIMDSKHEHRKVLKFIRNFNPELKRKVELYQDPIPLFDRFGVEAEINKALGKRVWLKSGGYLIIETTEALTSIDVNTGRFVGKKTLEETILKTNLEAAEELVRQLRLRNIGGIIIIDFIDMERESSKDQVYRYVENLVRDDKQRTTILKISNLGLVEMTRKRARTPIHRYLAESCPHCDGRGFQKSAITVAHQALRDMRRELPHCDQDYLHVVVSPDVFSILTKEEHANVVALEKSFQKGIKLQSDPNFHLEQVGISPSNAPKLKGAKLAPLPFMQKVEISENYFEDDYDRQDDEEAYQKDVQEIQSHRDEHLKKVQMSAEKARAEAAHKAVEQDEHEASVTALYADERNLSDEDADDSDDDSVDSPVIRSSEESQSSENWEDDDDDDQDDIEAEDSTTHASTS